MIKKIFLMYVVLCSDEFIKINSLTKPPTVMKLISAINYHES